MSLVSSVFPGVFLRHSQTLCCWASLFLKVPASLRLSKRSFLDDLHITWPNTLFKEDKLGTSK